MKTLYDNLSMIIGFFIMTFLIQLFLGDKFAEKSVLLILFTMIIINSDELSTFTSKITDKLSEEQKRKKGTTKTSKPILNSGVGGGGSKSW